MVLGILIVIDVVEEVDGVVGVFAEVGEFSLTFLDLVVVGLCYQMECLIEFVVDHSDTRVINKIINSQSQLLLIYSSEVNLVSFIPM